MLNKVSDAQEPFNLPRTRNALERSRRISSHLSPKHEVCKRFFDYIRVDKDRGKMIYDTCGN